MAYQDIATVNIALQSAGVSIQGFGIPLFASSHRYFPERVRAYSSLEEAALDLPTSSNAYQAVEAFFSNTPRPSVIKVGRREAALDLTVATGSTSAGFTLFANDGTDTFSVTINVTAELDESAVATAIEAAISGDADVSALVTSSVATDVVSLDTASANATFWVENLSTELSETYTSIETASELLAALTLEDDDFYFFTADDHTGEFVEAAAEAIEARTKMYFFSTQAQDSLTPYVDGSATDLLGKILVRLKTVLSSALKGCSTTKRIHNSLSVYM